MVTRKPSTAKPLKQELARAEAALAKLGEERSSLEAALTLSTATHAEMAAQGRRLKRIGEETEALEERWLELHAELDTLSESTS